MQTSFVADKECNNFVASPRFPSRYDTNSCLEVKNRKDRPSPEQQQITIELNSRSFMSSVSVNPNLRHFISSSSDIVVNLYYVRATRPLPRPTS